MKKLKKFATIGLVAVGLLASCGSTTAKVALITDLGDIDDKSFNQGSWEGILDYNEENRVSHEYYKPAEGTDAAYTDAIELAINNGAEIVVTPGFLFETAVGIQQAAHPDVHFVLLDAEPKKPDGSYGTTENTVAVLYAEEQSGYLAGYGVVQDGHRKLGFMGGMSVPAVRRFGLGYLMGAHDAAEDLEITEPITVRYHYTGGFDATPEVQAKAATWYQSGITAIFACGGSVGQSVMKAAEAAGDDYWVVGVDVDQAADSPRVLTSAVKGLGASVKLALERHFGIDGQTWQSGTINLDASQDGVGLPTAEDSWRFETWTVAQYETLYGELADGTVDPAELLPEGYLDTEQSVAVGELDEVLDLVTVTYEG